MLSNVRRALKTLSGLGTAGRSATIFSDDVILVSYPRSGNTWARFLVSNLLTETDAVTFSDIEQQIPDIHQHGDRTLLNCPRPRTLKSHEYFDPRYRKVVYLVRDPRDVALSYYYYHIKSCVFGPDYPLEQFVGRFVSGDLDGFGSWGEHVGSWVGARGDDPDFLVLRYEDMLDGPQDAVAAIARHLGYNVSPQQVSRAVELSRADRMRGLEQKQSTEWVGTRNTRSDYAFVRKAKAGTWKTDLPADCAKAMEASWGTMMRRFGYL